MLLHWLIRSLCRTRAELRLVLRVRAQYRAHLEQFGLSEPFKIRDRRVIRNRRISMLIGLLILHAQSPAIIATAIWSIPVLIGLTLWNLIARLLG